MDNRPGSPRKVGIVFNSILYGYCSVDIYLVDVDDYECFPSNFGLVWSYPPIEPTIKFQFPLCVGYVIDLQSPAVCLVNSTTLYMFDSNYPDDDDDRIPYSKSAYKFDLSSATQIPATSRMTMNHFKYFTKALPLPDGDKIIVFSSRFFFEESDSAFELFDCKDGSFHTIPPLPAMHPDPDCRCKYCTGESDRLITVDAYSFIGNSHFLLQLPMAQYALHLQDMAWTLLHRDTLPLQDSECGEYSESFRGYFQTSVARYAFLPTKLRYRNWTKISRAHRRAKVDHKVELNIHDVGSFFRQDARERDCCVRSYGGLSSLTPPYYQQQVFQTPHISVVPMKQEEEESKVCNTCIVQRHFDASRRTARFLIDFCCTDVTTLKTTIPKSVSLTVTNYEWGVYDIACFIL